MKITKTKNIMYRYNTKTIVNNEKTTYDNKYNIQITTKRQTDIYTKQTRMYIYIYIQRERERTNKTT